MCRVSAENVEVVKQAYEAFNQGGASAIRPFLAEDAEFREPPEQPAARIARGADEVVRLFGEFEAAWMSHKTQLDEVRAVDDDTVLALSVERFQGRDGIEVTAPFGAVFTLREGKITRWQAFWERRSALETAGVRE